MASFVLRSWEATLFTVEMFDVFAPPGADFLRPQT